ncbi:hypothetical protein ABKV19_027587 [Rosa sericea]
MPMSSPKLNRRRFNLILCNMRLNSNRRFKLMKAFQPPDYVPFMQFQQSTNVFQATQSTQALESSSSRPGFSQRRFKSLAQRKPQTHNTPQEVASSSK